MARKCNYCGGDIMYIEKTGAVKPGEKPIFYPADARPVIFVPSQSGFDLIVTNDGRQIYGDVVNENQPGAQLGYRSHHQTCPVPAASRRQQDNNHNADERKMKKNDPYQTRLY